MSTSWINGHFRGRFEIKIDPKGRLSLPTAYRQTLPTPEIIVTNSRYRGKSCLHVYTLPEWHRLERRIAKLSPLQADVQAFNRFYLSGGQVMPVDSQNRVLVPQSLRKFAGLESQVVLVGMGTHFEAWSMEAWNEIHEELTRSFEDTMSVVAGLDSGDESE